MAVDTATAVQAIILSDIDGAAPIHKIIVYSFAIRVGADGAFAAMAFERSTRAFGEQGGGSAATRSRFPFWANGIFASGRGSFHRDQFRGFRRWFQGFGGSFDKVVCRNFYNIGWRSHFGKDFHRGLRSSLRHDFRQDEGFGLAPGVFGLLGAIARLESRILEGGEGESLVKNASSSKCFHFFSPCTS